MRWYVRVSLRAAPCAGGSTRDRCFTLLRALRPCAAAGVLFGLPREALGCLAAARGRRSSARARQCWESLGAGLSGGGVSPPGEASRRPRRSAHTPPVAAGRVGTRHSNQKVDGALLDPSALWGELKSCPNAVASGAAAGLTPPRSSRVGRLLQGRRARRAATHRRRRRQKQPGRTRGRERRAAALAAALGGLILNSRRRQQRSARAATLGQSQQRAARGPECQR